MPGNIVLMKADVFQGKRKVKDRWCEVDYMVVCQVADDVTAYEVHDSGNLKIVHHNRLFLVATPQGEATPLGASESLSEEGATWSTLAELTPLGVGKCSPGRNMDEAETLCLTNRVLLGWVHGIQ